MKFPEQFREPHFGLVPSKTGDDYGGFIIPASSARRRPYPLRCVASSGTEEIRWQHVSVSTAARCPTWEEMCLVKRLFWDPHEAVIQFHPPEDDYVNQHPYCLHLWRPLDTKILLPPTIAVGVKA